MRSKHKSFEVESSKEHWRCRNVVYDKTVYVNDKPQKLVFAEADSEMQRMEHYGVYTGITVHKPGVSTAFTECTNFLSKWQAGRGFFHKHGSKTTPRLKIKRIRGIY